MKVQLEIFKTNCSKELFAVRHRFLELSGSLSPSASQDPELQARLMYTMGNVYLGLGLDSRAQSLLEHAMDIPRLALGPNQPQTLETAMSLGKALRFQGRYPDAEKLDRQTLEVQRRVLGPQHPDTVGAGAPRGR